MHEAIPPLPLYIFMVFKHRDNFTFTSLVTEGSLSLGVKLTTHLHLVPRSKNEWSYTSTPQYAFMT
jgi:hypothetical protein